MGTTHTLWVTAFVQCDFKGFCRSVTRLCKRRGGAGGGLDPVWLGQLRHLLPCRCLLSLDRAGTHTHTHVRTHAHIHMHARTYTAVQSRKKKTGSWAAHRLITALTASHYSAAGFLNTPRDKTTKTTREFPSRDTWDLFSRAQNSSNNKHTQQQQQHKSDGRDICLTDDWLTCCWMSSFQETWRSGTRPKPLGNTLKPLPVTQVSLYPDQLLNWEVKLTYRGEKHLQSAAGTKPTATELQREPTCSRYFTSPAPSEPVPTHTHTHTCSCSPASRSTGCRDPFWNKRLLRCVLLTCSHWIQSPPTSWRVKIHSFIYLIIVCIVRWSIKLFAREGHTEGELISEWDAALLLYFPSVIKQ